MLAQHLSLVGKRGLLPRVHLWDIGDLEEKVADFMGGVYTATALSTMKSSGVVPPYGKTALKAALTQVSGAE